MEDKGIARCRRRDCFEERSHIKLANVGGGPWMRSVAHANRVGNLWMIRPGWIAHPNLSLWSQACHQLHGEPNGSGSAWCVQHLHASAGCDRRERAEWGSRLAEDKCAHQLHERWVAADRLVKLGS